MINVLWPLDWFPSQNETIQESYYYMKIRGKIPNNTVWFVFVLWTLFSAVISTYWFQSIAKWKLILPLCLLDIHISFNSHLIGNGVKGAGSYWFPGDGCKHEPLQGFPPWHTFYCFANSVKPHCGFVSHKSPHTKCRSRNSCLSVWERESSCNPYCRWRVSSVCWRLCSSWESVNISVWY